MLALNQFGVQSIIGASDKLISIIRMGFGDAELAPGCTELAPGCAELAPGCAELAQGCAEIGQGCRILRLHDPHNFVLLERELGSQTFSQRNHVVNVLSERGIWVYNTNLSRFFVRVDMRLPVLLQDFVSVFLIEVHFCQAATPWISSLSENSPDTGSAQ